MGTEAIVGTRERMVNKIIVLTLLMVKETTVETRATMVTKIISEHCYLMETEAIVETCNNGNQDHGLNTIDGNRGHC